MHILTWFVCGALGPGVLLFSWMYFFLASIYPTKKKGSMLQFDDLPESIIYDIFALLPPEDLVPWSQVNHKFCRIAGDSYVRKS